MADYFARYEATFDLPVRRAVEVTAVRDTHGGRFQVTSHGDGWLTRAVINATGTWTEPSWPYYPVWRRTTFCSRGTPA